MQLPRLPKQSLQTKLQTELQHSNFKHLAQSQTCRHLSVSQHCVRQLQSILSKQLSLSAMPSTLKSFTLSPANTIMRTAAGMQIQQTVTRQQFLQNDCPVFLIHLVKVGFWVCVRGG